MATELFYNNNQGHLSIPCQCSCSLRGHKCRRVWTELLPNNRPLTSLSACSYPGTVSCVQQTPFLDLTDTVSPGIPLPAPEIPLSVHGRHVNWFESGTFVLYRLAVKSNSLDCQNPTKMPIKMAKIKFRHSDTIRMHRIVLELKPELI